MIEVDKLFGIAKRLYDRLIYRLSFFCFLRMIENKSSFILPFFTLLYYKMYPDKLDNYKTAIRLFGKNFVVRDLTDILVLKETFYEECYKSLFSDLHKATTLIDLGSFIGDVTIYAQQFPQVKKIILIEPDPRNIIILKKNLALNSVKNATVIQSAISGKDGYSFFNLGRERIASSLNEPKSTKAQIKVSTISLSKILKSIKTSNIIVKSDCEGAEYDFIMQTPINVLSKISKMIFEYHMDKNKLKRVVDRLTKAGFRTRCEDLILEPNVGMAYSNKD